MICDTDPETHSTTPANAEPDLDVTNRRLDLAPCITHSGPFPSTYRSRPGRKRISDGDNQSEHRVLTSDHLGKATILGIVINFEIEFLISRTWLVRWASCILFFSSSRPLGCLVAQHVAPILIPFLSPSEPASPFFVPAANLTALSPQFPVFPALPERTYMVNYGDNTTGRRCF